MYRYDSVNGAQFFGRIIVGAAVALLLLMLMTLWEDILTKRESAQRYASDFYAILQGEREYARFVQDAEETAKKILLLREDKNADAWLNIFFQYSALFQKNSNEAYLLARAEIMKRKFDGARFNDLRDHVQKKEFAVMAEREEDRTQIKAIVLGKNIPAVSVKLDTPPLWYILIAWVFVAQGAITASYLFCSPFSERKWWHLDWSLRWLYAITPLWFPGGLPCVLFAALVSWSAAWMKKAVSLRRRNNVASEGRDSIGVIFNKSVPDGDALLARLSAKVRREK